MTLGDFLGNGQAKTGALLVLGCVGFVEAVKNVGQLLRLDSHSMICHSEHRMGTVLHRNLDASVFVGEFHGVVQQNHQQLADSSVVAHHPAILLRQLYLHRDMLCLRLSANPPGGIRDDIAQIHLLHGKPESGILQAGQLQQVIHQSLHMAAF